MSMHVDSGVNAAVEEQRRPTPMLQKTSGWKAQWKKKKHNQLRTNVNVAPKKKTEKEKHHSQM